MIYANFCVFSKESKAEKQKEQPQIIPFKKNLIHKVFIKLCRHLNEKLLKRIPFNKMFPFVFSQESKAKEQKRTAASNN